MSNAMQLLYVLKTSFCLKNKVCQVIDGTGVITTPNPKKGIMTYLAIAAPCWHEHHTASEILLQGPDPNWLISAVAPLYWLRLARLPSVMMPKEMVMLLLVQRALKKYAQ
jgi:hypothetical protein